MHSLTDKDQSFAMLMASGSPGSARAYQMTQTADESYLPRRNMATMSSGEPLNQDFVPDMTGTKNTTSTPSKSNSIGGVLGRLFDRFEAWSSKQEIRATEAYLAQAQDIYDLEARMRLVDSDTFRRGQVFFLRGVR